MAFWKKAAKTKPPEDVSPAECLRRRRRVEPLRNRPRFVLAIGMFCAVYAVIGGRLLFWGVAPDEAAAYSAMRHDGSAPRPDLIDRNGEVLATDIRSASLFAEPRKVVDADEATELLLSVLPDMNPKFLHNRLSGTSGFAWLKRDITPAQMQAIHMLGIPGVGFRTEKRRFYPGGNTASHVVGHVNIDNQGIAGMEKYVDDSGYRALQNAGLAFGTDLEPVELSLDVRVQHVVRDELAAAMEKYQAIAAGSVILDVETGEVVAMASLPDYDPNNPVDALKKENLNRMSAGTFEMGSTFKAFTTAMALDSGKVRITDSFDARAPIRIGGFTISDYRGKNRVLTVPEIFMYSSNIGTARQADAVGVAEHKSFLTRLGLLSRMQTELPEVAMPTQPREWKKINSITISFGHGVSTTPLQTAVAAAALVNGGYLIPPTFLPRSKADADAMKVPVISQRTSDEMRYLFHLNGEQGSGRSANVAGYDVGGKTGTAEKVENGRYQQGKRFNAYLGAFPMSKPRYVVLVVLDEPQRAPGQPFATAGWNAAPTVANIVRRTATFLDVRPNFGEKNPQLLVSY
ncbi:penicillin-binding protein 2 [Aureimonas fodinaquatilis]|uniref:Penicillin-binding protein 2 n=2 Tax=Aureimonas fodinaquatilis TaxID=2565783 RepID=A0A5B0E0Z6_9HYPH|nr:penicillin-binding protein 2 [Aureimonas fodinaquatilis]